MATRSPRRSGPGGSAGRRPGQAAQSIRRTTRVDPPRPLGTVRGSSTFTRRALVLLLVVAVLGVSYASSIRAWLNQRSEQSALTAQIVAEHEAIAQLRIAKARWNDPAYIEAQARLRFGWVLPGERGYRVIGKSGKVLRAETSQLPTTSLGAQAQQPPWWAGTVKSLVAADAGAGAARSRPAGPAHAPATLIGPSSSTTSSSTPTPSNPTSR